MYLSYRYFYLVCYLNFHIESMYSLPNRSQNIDNHWKNENFFSLPKRNFPREKFSPSPKGFFFAAKKPETAAHGVNKTWWFISAGHVMSMKRASTCMMVIHGYTWLYMIIHGYIWLYTC